ncbi:MAG: response regulator [Bacillota bacterium]
MRISPRVLIVDDDRNICFTVETIGSYAGWTVHSCLDARSGISALGVFNPDIVLLDYHLPLMDGLTALPEFRKRNPSVPIIMLTVEDDRRVAEKCREAGASDFSLKPIKALDLIYRVNLNLEVSRLRQQDSTPVTDTLEKGLNQETLDLVLEFSKNRAKAFTINEAVEALQLGYSTVHRYLSYLEELGYLTVSHGYGKQGRPRKRYTIRKMELS